jgi:signal transduction histidine kinase/ligand-binding sensor domain-containing protein
VRHPVVLATTLFSVLLALCAGAFALDPSLDVSQYAHTAGKIREGFAKGAIHWVAQTPDGYLWLGTEFGLLRFDGVRSVPWQPPDGEQLPNNRIGPLLVAHDGTLWIGTFKGLASWKDGKLTQYPGTAGIYVLSLFEDREQTIWFGLYDASKGRLCRVRAAKVECYGEGMFGDSVAAIYQDHNGILWATSQTGLWRWAPGPPKQYPFPRGVTEANSLIEDDAGALLLATNGGLKQLVAGKIENYPLPGITGQFRPSRLYRSSDGSLWISTQQGLLRVGHGRVDGFRAPDGLSGDAVGAIFEDREGNVWVPTTDGLDRFREYPVPTISRNQGLSNSLATSVQTTPDGTVWISTPDGLNRWANGHVTVYRGRSALSESRAADGTKLNVSGAATEIANSGFVGTPQSLGLDDEGRLLASTDKGLFYFERGRFARVSGGPGGYTFSIAGDGHGSVWILQRESLFRWSPDAAVQQIPWSQFAPKLPRTMLPDREPGGLWLGFFNGGLVYLRDGKAVRSYGAEDGLLGRVNHLRFGPNGGLWASTEGGLSHIKNGHIATMTQENGLPCDEVHWSMEDDDHAVWLYMPCGLVRIIRSELDAWINDPKHVLKATILDNSDGVRSFGIYGSIDPHVTKSPDGKIWFVPGDGVSVIEPRHLSFNKLPPPVDIEQIIADHKTYDKPADSNGQVSIPPRVLDLQIEYTALSLVAPEKVLFRYKLEGWDRDWQDVGTRRQAFYSNLPPRKYRFRVMACNNSGVWNEAGTFLDFSIAPAYYQTNWFRLSLVAAFLAALWGLYQFRLRQLAREFNMRLDERVSERTRIARELHDTLLQNVQGLILKIHAIGKRIPTTDPTRQEIEKTLDFADQVMAEGRDRVRNLRTSTIGFGGLPKAFQRVVEEAAPNRSSTFKMVVEGTVLELHPIIREETYSIGREALINALTHSEANNIEAEITYEAREFRLRIRDDGRGIDPAVLEKGGRDDHWGLQGMRERAKRIGGKLDLWSRPGSGTEVELTVPASTAYRSPGRKSTDSESRISAAR